MLLLIGGLVCGLAAGAATRYGRVCSMSAIEDALLARDYRVAKAWCFALAVALLASQVGAAAGAFDLKSTVYSATRFDIVGAAIGGIIFGFGMAMVGTCSFGLLVRAGGGDLRAVVSAVVVGAVAFSFTAGFLAPLRLAITDIAPIDLAELAGGPTIADAVARSSGRSIAQSGLIVAAVFAALATIIVVADRRLRKRPRLLIAATGLGLAVAGGWIVTGAAVERMEIARAESLSFVAPVGRMLVQFMTDTLRDSSFAVSSVIGVVGGATAVAIFKREVRWEAFDDAREMRRHFLGAVLMGIGGVLARGCTIGQGMSAASTLAISAPVVVAGVVIGAKIGLSALLEGRALWRLGSNV